MQHQRTRHASLDFPRTNKRLSPQDEWCEFLSTSMAALTTDEEDDDQEIDVGSRSLSSLNGLEMRRNGNVFEPLGPPNSSSRGERTALNGGKPKRRDSFSESLTSSTGSSPAGAAAWRPLGRRASAHIIPTSNQMEHHAELFGFDLPPRANSNGAAKKMSMAHSSSFRDLQLSSSGSSLVESSSSDEEANNNDSGGFGSNNNSNNNRESRRPAMLEMDQPYAGGSPLPPLSTLSEASRSGSMAVVDAHVNQMMHVKSPVLSSRKDSQTWQLQNEELLTSPRFGQFRSSLDEASASMFGGGMGVFAEESNNQVNDAREARAVRATKDARASSVDFTYARPADLNAPPLPPSQEPQYQRMRARSFSYSAGFGSNNFNPAYANKQYMPQHPPQADFPVTMRQFHNGAPPPPQPVSMMQQGPVRPPRVSIPSHDHHAYHQQQQQQQFQQQQQQQLQQQQQQHLHQAPTPPYRRYSTDFAAPMFHEQMPPHDPEGVVPVHRTATPTGRCIRSYSMEYFQSTNPRVRTQSLEGNQMFASGAPPPVEYPVMSRHTSGAVSYEWPRSPPSNAPVAPPLPPDSRVGNGNAGLYPPPPPPEAYYEVEFKRGRIELFAGKAGFNPGEFVKVEADRGEDIGRIARRITDLSKLTGHNNSSSPEPPAVSHGDDPLSRAPKRHELPAKKIINVASAREFELLTEQRKEEHEVFEICKSKVRQRLLPMNVIDAEYQYDRHKLTFFFEADRRIDFRELVRDLFAIYKTRIWLQQVVPSGKKPMNEFE